MFSKSILASLLLFIISSESKRKYRVYRHNIDVNTVTKTITQYVTLQQEYRAVEKTVIANVCTADTPVDSVISHIDNTISPSTKTVDAPAAVQSTDAGVTSTPDQSVTEKTTGVPKHMIHISDSVDTHTLSDFVSSEMNASITHVNPDTTPTQIPEPIPSLNNEAVITNTISDTPTKSVDALLVDPSKIIDTIPTEIYAVNEAVENTIGVTQSDEAIKETSYIVTKTADNDMAVDSHVALQSSVQNSLENTIATNTLVYPQYTSSEGKYPVGEEPKYYETTSVEETTQKKPKYNIENIDENTKASRKHGYKYEMDQDD